MIWRTQPSIPTQTVAIVPDGPLHYFPFAALHDGSDYLSKDHTFYYLPAASVLAMLPTRATAVPKKPLVIAGGQYARMPELAKAKSAAAAFAGLFGTQAVAGDSSAKKLLETKGLDADPLYLAGHAELSADAPMFTRMYLGSGKDPADALELRDLYEMQFGKADLVLTGCQTQLGPRSAGADLVALNRAFLASGAASVVASLWKVNEESTAELMSEFGKQLRAGKGAALALQIAQNSVRKRYRNPHDWAAFVLSGRTGLSDGKPVP